MIRPPVFALSLFSPRGGTNIQEMRKQTGCAKKFGRYLCKRWLSNPPWTPCNLQVVSDLRKVREKKNLLDIPHIAIPYLFRAFPRDYMTFSEMEEKPRSEFARELCGGGLPSLPCTQNHFLASRNPYVRTCLPMYNFFSLSGREGGGGRVEERPHPCVGM